eukprot:SAG31_NODE_1050_length_10160_cov_3.844648_2_plen_54_part_00
MAKRLSETVVTLRDELLLSETAITLRDSCYSQNQLTHKLRGSKQDHGTMVSIT